MMIFASEDVGLADSRALMVVTSADAAFRRMGMPEGMYPLAHAATYLACTPKSNAIKEAWHRAKAAIEAALGANYKYPHDYEGNVAPGETYLPDALQGARFYEPSMNGEEARITKRLDELRGPRREP
jgi:putative ATPase